MLARIGFWLVASFPLITLAIADDALLKWMDSIAQRQLDQRAAAIAKIQTKEAAEARKAVVRAKILELIGGLPNYQGPLNARVTGRIEQAGYTIENVIFESLPQVFVTANLYRPTAAGRYPGVLLPLGHWEEGKPAVQRIAANLALKGFVTLVYDPIGQGERLQSYDSRLHLSLAGGSVDQHNLLGAQAILAGQAFARYRIWDAKRALDYLVSRPEVDADKIGCTGCSGGGTLTTYISALDPRIKVAAPSCYMNTFRLLFSGPTGDAEQSIPFFLSSGLDMPDYVELFAPKPWLMSSTIGDFFPLEGARQVYQEGRRWYGLYGAQDKIRWAIGPGGHGTPVEIREAIYEWMIRWLKDGTGDAKEQAIEMLPDFKLWATATGEVEGREIYQVIAADAHARESARSQDELRGELKKWVRPGAAPSRVTGETVKADVRIQQIALEVEPGLEIAGTLYLPRGAGRKRAVVMVNLAPELAERTAARGAVALTLQPRSSTETPRSKLTADWITNTRALLIGRDLAGMRASDIVAGVQFLKARADVDAKSIHAASRGVAGIWMLMAAAVEPGIESLWLDKTPVSMRAAFDQPLHRDLYDAVIPGFALKWDLADLVKAIAPRRIMWSDPVDWMGVIARAEKGAQYRVFEEGDERFLRSLLEWPR